MIALKKTLYVVTCNKLVLYVFLISSLVVGYRDAVRYT